jgi:hypothetical protein
MTYTKISVDVSYLGSLSITVHRVRGLGRSIPTNFVLGRDFAPKPKASSPGMGHL